MIIIIIIIIPANYKSITKVQNSLYSMPLKPFDKQIIAWLLPHTSSRLETKKHKTIRWSRWYTYRNTICLSIILPMRNIRCARTQPESVHTCNAVSIGPPSARPPNRLGYFSVLTPTQQVQESPVAIYPTNIFVYVHMCYRKSPNFGKT
jgi:hypothetical protein